MRIAVVTTSWPQHEGDPSGHFVQAHARELERAGNEVLVVAPMARSAFGWPGVAARLRARPLRVIDAAQWVAGACARLRRLKVDRVVAHWCIPSAWPIATLAAARWPPNPGGALPGAGLDVVSHGADIRLLAAMPSRAARKIVSAVAERASSWTFPSHATRLELFAALDATTRAAVDRISEVRAPPIEMPDISAAVAALRGELGSRRVAVSVGRLVIGKRVDRAIDYVARTRGAEVLVVVGDGPDRPRLEALARDRGVDARFVGKVDRPEALAWIGAASALIHASVAEGLSTVLREAAALGTPVVRLDL
jgi:glycosyltransferase involved in cell wall biosynthesis